MVQLEDEDVLTIKDDFTRIVNAVRTYNIPLINFMIISILTFFLLKLTTKYNNLYMKSSLITILITNLVLYGISETLAQSLISYDSQQPVISFKLRNEIVSLPDEESVIDDIDHFINFVDDVLPFDTSPPIVPLSFFNFNRLAGFMCWGAILSFFQCWWYKFLQIYSKDPKFIEVIQKVLTDQLCYSPVSLFCFFIYGTIILENGDWVQAKEKLKKIYLSTLLINYCVWFPIQFLNFLIVSRNYQVPFSSSISVLWNCFLSMRNAST